MNFSSNCNSKNRIRNAPLSQKKRSYFSSVAARLKNREIYGYFSREAVCKKNSFGIIPRRFAFPLKSLVRHYALHEGGHVFLGFSSCDRFLISYTEVLSGTATLPLYTLHWWLWSPGGKAKIVESIRLFGNEVTEYSLCLCYAEWPTLKSHIVVYGCSKHSDNAYITIATVPDLMPCQQCHELRSSSGDKASKLLCVDHGYTVHFKQASGACQMGVLNRSGLNINGMLVLNIGHSITVLSTGRVQDCNDIENLPLSSIKRSACEDPITETEPKDCGDSTLTVEESLINPIQYSAIEVPSLKEVMQDIPIDTLSLKSWSSAKSLENHTQSLGNIEVYEPDSDGSEKYVKITLRQNKENINENHCKKFEYLTSVDIDPYFDPEPKSIVLSSSNIQECQSTEISNIGKDSNDHLLHPTSHSMQSFNSDSNSYSGHSPIMSRHLINQRSGPSILNEKQNMLENSRSDLSFMTPSPPASDGSSSFQFSESALNMNGGRPGSNTAKSDGLVSFSETFFGPIYHGSNEENDDTPAGETNFQLCTMLCLGASGDSLHPIDKDHPAVQGYSQQLVLDLEHVIFDILRTRCYAAYKYGYLVDYEANILDVCSSTKSVIIHVAALLNMQSIKTKRLHSVPTGTAPRQQAQFILCWSLSTGRYEVVIARPLEPYNEGKFGEWKGDWIVPTDTRIKQQCAIPTEPRKSVYILDNSAVLRGQSLNVLWNCDKTLAITK